MKPPPQHPNCRCTLEGDDAEQRAAFLRMLLPNLPLDDFPRTACGMLMNPTDCAVMRYLAGANHWERVFGFQLLPDPTIAEGEAMVFGPDECYLGTITLGH